MAAGGFSPVSAIFPGSRPRTPRGKARRSEEMEELAMILPGAQGKEGSAEKLLLSAISYIQFLQRKIQEAHSKLMPYSNHLDLQTLLNPKHSVTHKRRNAHPGIRRKWRSRGSVLKPKLKSNRIPRQRLVPYISSSSSDNGDGGPWLVSVCMSPQCPLSPCTPQSSSAALLELSPLLLSPPQALFQELEFGTWSEDVQDTAVSAFFMDHSNNEPQQPTQESDVWAESPEPTQQLPLESLETGSRVRKCIRVYSAKSKARRLQACYSTSRDDTNTASSADSAATALTQKPRTHCRLQQQQLRKKCVNGFIMFCRLNRRLYLSAHPGKASAAATKDLAELWKGMSVQERHPYCMKALQFSLLHNRMVKSSYSRFPNENVSPPKPVLVLMAEKAAQSQKMKVEL